jgi:hypothetical protein
VNQARSGRYYAEEFDERMPTPWGVIVAMSVLAAIFIAGAAFYADGRGFDRGRAFQAGSRCRRVPRPLPRWSFRVANA